MIFKDGSPKRQNTLVFDANPDRIVAGLTAAWTADSPTSQEFELVA